MEVYIKMPGEVPSRGTLQSKVNCATAATLNTLVWRFVMQNGWPSILCKTEDTAWYCVGCSDCLMPLLQCGQYVDIGNNRKFSLIEGIFN